MPDTYRSTYTSPTVELHGREGHDPSSVRIQKGGPISWKIGTDGVKAARFDHDGKDGMYVTVREGYDSDGKSNRWVERQASISLDEAESRALYAMLHARYGPKGGIA